MKRTIPRPSLGQCVLLEGKDSVINSNLVLPSSLNSHHPSIIPSNPSLLSSLPDRALAHTLNISLLDYFRWLHHPSCSQSHFPLTLTTQSNLSKIKLNHANTLLISFSGSPLSLNTPHFFKRNFHNGQLAIR